MDIGCFPHRRLLWTEMESVVEFSYIFKNKGKKILKNKFNVWMDGWI